MAIVPEEKKNAIQEVTDETYDKLVFGSVGRVVLILGADWCPDSCHLFEKVLPAYLEKYGDRVVFLNAVMQKECGGPVLCPAIKNVFMAQRYPTVVAFKDGQLVDRFVSEESQERGAQVRDFERLFAKLA